MSRDKWRRKDIPDRVTRQDASETYLDLDESDISDLSLSNSKADLRLVDFSHSLSYSHQAQAHCIP